MKVIRLFLLLLSAILAAALLLCACANPKGIPGKPRSLKPEPQPTPGQSRRNRRYELCSRTPGKPDYADGPFHFLSRDSLCADEFDAPNLNGE